MLLQALAQYADSRLRREQNDPAFEKKRVSYLLEIGWNGTFLGVTDCHGPIQPDQTERQPAPALLAPRSPTHRTDGVHPLLACDNVRYVLGFDEKHVAFVTLLEEAADTTSDPALRSCVAFFQRPEEVHSARKCLAAYDPPPGAWIALSVGGPVIDRKGVRAYWRQTYAREFNAQMEAGQESMCLVSGQIGPIARTHAKIKGVTAVGGSPTGVSFASFGKEAYQSYGWRQAENSPVLPDRATSYVLALNHLLKGGKCSRVDHGTSRFLSRPAAPWSRDIASWLCRDRRWKTSRGCRTKISKSSRESTTTTGSAPPVPGCAGTSSTFGLLARQ